MVICIDNRKKAVKERKDYYVFELYRKIKRSFKTGA